MNLDDFYGGLESYVSGSILDKRPYPENYEKDLKLFETVEKNIKSEEARKTKANIDNPMEDDDSYDEYYSEPENKNRNVPYYIIVEKARLAARYAKI